MKLTGRGLLIIDRLFWLPHRLLESLLIRTIEKKKDTILIIKFMGLGSLVLLARLMEQHKVDKSKVTLLTFARHQAFCDLFGFQSTVYIRTTTVYHFIKDCLSTIRKVRIIQPSIIIDFERCSHAVSVFRNWLAISCRCQTISFEVDEQKQTNREVIYSIKDMTYEEIFLKGIKEMSKIIQDITSKEVNVQHNRILININASDYLLARRYPLDLYVQVVKALQQWNSKLEFYFTGTSFEKEYVEQLINLTAGCNVFNMAGQWSLEMLMRELASCSLFMTGDSGPMHMAAYLNTPSIVIWGPTQPAHFGYENHPSLHHLSMKMACAPCFTHPQSNPTKACEGKIDCLKNLTPDTISQKAISILSKPQSTRIVTGQAVQNILPESKRSYIIA